MKSDELHEKVRKNGWMQVRQNGSHVIYQKGNQIYPVPYHRGQEIGKELLKKMIKEMKLK